MFTVIIDDSLFVLTANEPDSSYLVAQNLRKGKHKLEIYKRTEWHGGNTTFLGLKLDHGAKVIAPPPRQHKIEFIGDSYTCGYGNEGLSHDEHFRYETENNYLSYGAITARELDADYFAVCRSGIGMFQGYGGNRSFNMPEYYNEITLDSTKKWDYSVKQPDLVVINLAANDLSAPLDSAAFIQAYTSFVKRVRSNYPGTNIVCIAGPSGGGEEWRMLQSYIHTVVNECAKTDETVRYFGFSPFEMHGSDWHPNLAEHRNMANELTPYLKQLMHW
jgi:lysophospholipase L1-like esterase